MKWFLCCGGSCLLALMVGRADSATQWLQFRGSESNSVAKDERLPASWSVSENVAWKVDLPGRGPSSPIVVDGKVVVTSASGGKQERLHVNCFDAGSGKQLWERRFWATGRTVTHPSISTATPTPASDGKLVFAFFSSNDLVCLDLDGKLKWLRGLAYDFPATGNDVGMASSPVVADGTVIVQLENQGDSFAAGIDAATGETRWRLPRERVANYTSPVAMKANGGKSVVLLQSPSRLTAHDAATGELEWEYKVGCSDTTSLLVDGDRVIVPSQGMTALQPSGRGSEPEILWKSAKLQPGAASPLVHEGKLYFINRSGVLVCADESKGDIIWQLRLSGAFWGTPVLAGDRLYCVNQEGAAQVVQLSPDGKKPTLAGSSEVGETVQSSPAAADRGLYIRADRHLWKIATP